MRIWNKMIDQNGCTSVICRNSSQGMGTIRVCFSKPMRCANSFSRNRTPSEESSPPCKKLNNRKKVEWSKEGFLICIAVKCRQIREPFWIFDKKSNDSVPITGLYLIEMQRYMRYYIVSQLTWIRWCFASGGVSHPALSWIGRCSESGAFYLRAGRQFS